jgi:hypothetical protein
MPFKKFGYWWFYFLREMNGPYRTFDDAHAAQQVKMGVKPKTE